MFNPKKVFVLSPHPDDAEIGCGGTIARLLENGTDVYVLVFGKDDVRAKELRRATEIFNLSGLFTYQVPIRNFDKFRQGILQKLVDMREKYKPDVVFQPSLDDIHQDHKVIANEGLRAFKTSTILGYEASWNNLNFEAQMFVELTESQLGKKLRALRCYRSQADKPYMDSEYVKSLAKVRGAQVGVKYAEMFNVVRQVV